MCRGSVVDSVSGDLSVYRERERERERERKRERERQDQKQIYFR